MGIVLEGDGAAQWLSWAESKLRNLKRLMALNGRPNMWEIHPLPDGSGKAYIANMFGQNDIRIEVVGGEAFIVIGLIETADNLLGPLVGTGIKYLLSHINSQDVETKRVALGTTENPVRESDYLYTVNGTHRVYFITRKYFYTGKYHQFTYANSYPERTYAWRIRKFSHAYELKYDVTESGVEGTARVFAEDTDGIYVVGELLKRDPIPALWATTGRIERRNTDTGELDWYHNKPAFWAYGNATSNDTDLFVIAMETLYDIVTAHVYNVPTIEKRSKATGNLTWFVQKDPGFYGGVGGWALLGASAILADADYHYVAWIEYTVGTYGKEWRCRVSKIANSNGTTTEWTVDYVPSQTIGYTETYDLGQFSITGCARSGNQITYCGYFTSYSSSREIWIAFCVNLADGTLAWQQEGFADAVFLPGGYSVSPGTYEDVAYSDRLKRWIFAGRKDLGADMVPRTVIIDMRSPDSGSLVKTASLKNNSRYLEAAFIQIMRGADS